MHNTLRTISNHPLALVLFALLSVIASPLAAVAQANASQRLLLSGTWRFALDPQDDGVDDGWWNSELPERIDLPGTTDSGGFGNPAPSTTMGLARSHAYTGVAWYQREVNIPEGWSGRRVQLSLERAHWITQAWLDNQPLGRQDSMSTPHVYDLPANLPAGMHTLTLRIDNRLGFLGDFAHAVGVHTQTNWNGIIGRIELTSTPKVWIERVRTFPDLEKKSLGVEVTIGNDTAEVVDVAIAMTVTPTFENVSALQMQQGNVRAEPLGLTTRRLEYHMGESVQTWDEFSPRLYQLLTEVEFPGLPSQTDVTRFGMREVGVIGTNIAINGRPIFLRGANNGCQFPLTAVPPMDKDGWIRLMRVVKSYGLNHIRFHSWCPPEAAFNAADQEGVYLAPELPTTTAEPEEYLLDEGDRILRAYGNHPSFIMLSGGNEMYYGAQSVGRFLARMVEHLKSMDSRHLYLGSTGSELMSVNDYQSIGSRLRHGPAGIGPLAPHTLMDYASAWPDLPPTWRVNSWDGPLVSHELGQWCAYPDFQEIEKYTGVLRAHNYEIYRDRLAEAGMRDMADTFVRSSGALQALMYKAEIETQLRTPGLAGFQLLDLTDYPGQGTAPVGVVNSFLEPKKYLSPDQFRMFCDTTVPLLRVSKFEWTSNEVFEAQYLIAHFAETPLREVNPYWRISNDAGEVIAEGLLEPMDIPLGSGTFLGRFSAPLKDVSAPVCLTVELGLKDTRFRNQWRIWVFPDSAVVTIPEPLVVTDALDESAIDALNAGRDVLMLRPGGKLTNAVPGSFRPIFWNAYHFPSEGDVGLGIVCDATHPALAGFPTTDHTDWQWWYLLRQSQSLMLQDAPPQLKPIVQVIDDWNQCRKLGLIFESRVGSGRLLFCGIDLLELQKEHPAARQLLASLIGYMGSDAFEPMVSMSVAEAAVVFAPESNLARYKRVKATSAAPGPRNFPPLACDGKRGTQWRPSPVDRQPSLEVDLGDIHVLRTIQIVWEEDMPVPQYTVESSSDGQAWTGLELRPEIATPTDSSTHIIEGVSGRFVRLVFNPSDDTSIGVAELRVFEADK